ncbi:hypothetical protein scyTo_0020812, partial [Scyliorhinus torazame]|nr:hypothetical protein [Scyliorhinus torazame]
STNKLRGVEESSTMEGSDELLFFVNGRKVVEKNVDPELNLLTYLRKKCIHER